MDMKNGRKQAIKISFLLLNSQHKYTLFGTARCQNAIQVQTILAPCCGHFQVDHCYQQFRGSEMINVSLCAL